MPTYTGVVESQLIASAETQWSNIYHVTTANPATALTDLEAIANIQADVMYSLARVFRIGIRGSNTPGANGLFETVNIPGSVTPVGSDVLPLWNVAVIEFNVLGYRPTLKYLKLPLLEESVNGSVLTNGVLTSLSTAFISPLLGQPNFTNNHGLTFTDGAARASVGMRQTDWNRRFRPGFHRGWVPNA